MIEKPKIFLSYAREDAASVTPLYDRLTRAGFKPWMDTRDVLPGQNWKYHTKQALQQADLVIVCMSKISVVKRSFIQREIRTALDRLEERLDSDIYLIPIKLDACDVPENLSHLQWIDIFAEGGWETLLMAITSALKQTYSIAEIANTEHVSLLLITSPHDGATVSRRPVVSGSISAQNVSVWVVVHPVGSSSFWVQPATTIHAQGGWGAQVYIGRLGTADDGKRFEIMAVANPMLELQEGMILDQWPAAEYVSSVIEVTRGKSELSQLEEQRVSGTSIDIGSVGGQAIVVVGDNNKVESSKGSRSTRNKAR